MNIWRLWLENDLKNLFRGLSNFSISIEIHLSDDQEKVQQILFQLNDEQSNRHILSIHYA